MFGPHMLCVLTSSLRLPLLPAHEILSVTPNSLTTTWCPSSRPVALILLYMIDLLRMLMLRNLTPLLISQDINVFPSSQSQLLRQS